MEGLNKSTSSSEVLRTEDTCADYYSGTKDDLIAAGLCKATWFPEELPLMWRTDGTPYMGNNGRQRRRRTFTVEGREPETILTYRRRDGEAECWGVRIAVNADERRRREAAQKAKWEKDHRELCEIRERSRREKEAAQDAARPIVMALRQRYPDCTVEGEIRADEDGTRRQNLTFYARSLEVLVGYGLVTQEMLDQPENDGRYRSGKLRAGGQFWLDKDTYRDGEWWRCTLYTDDTPRERKHLPVTEARQLLKRLAGQSGR